MRPKTVCLSAAAVSSKHEVEIPTTPFRSHGLEAEQKGLA